LLVQKAVIHIGSGKTGSTAIQRALFEASRNGGLGDFYYPTVNGWHHRDIYILFKKKEASARNLKSRIRAGKIDYDRYRKAYDAEFSPPRLAGKNLILSSEYLFDLPSEQVRALKQRLDDSGVRDYLVVAYVRHPASYYLSYVQQRLKASHVIPDPCSFRYPLKKVLDAWAGVFGQLIVREYDQLMSRGGDAVRDFGETIANAGFGHLILQARTANPSLGAEAMLLMQEYRRLFHADEDNVFLPDSDRFLQQLEKIHVKATVPRLNRRVWQLISSKHQSDIEYLTKHYGLFADQEDEVVDASESASDFVRPLKVTDVVDGLEEDRVQEFALNVIRKLLRE